VLTVVDTPAALAGPPTVTEAETPAAGTAGLEVEARGAIGAGLEGAATGRAGTFGVETDAAAREPPAVTAGGCTG
jgi:hypothetical protein